MRIQANDKTIVMKPFWQICFCLVLLFCIAAISYPQASQARRGMKSSHPQVVAPKGVQAASRTPVRKPQSPAQIFCFNQAKYSLGPQGANFTYRICHVPDIDQRRAPGSSPLVIGLPNEGKMYCAPTAAMNWMAYIANHGYPQLQPYPGDWQLGPPSSPGVYNAMSLALISMGGSMNTDPNDKGGTGGGDAEKGMQDWLDTDVPGQFVVSHYYASGSYSPLFADMAISAISGNLVIPVMGWYTNADTSYDHIRKGGHVVSLVAADQDTDSASNPVMGIRDPANDSQLTTQSTFATDSYYITDVYGTFGYTDDNNVTHTFQRTQSRVIGYGAGYLDEYFAICPKYGLTASDDSLIFLKFVKLLGSDQPERMTFQSATGGRITDLAIHPERTRHPYLVENSDAIWQIDTLTGLSSKFAAVEKPKRIVFGGPDQNLYALLPRHLVCLDRNGAQRQIALLRTPLDAIAFDESKKRLVGVSREARQLFFFDTDLNPMGSDALPSIPGDGFLRLSVNPVDGTIWLRGDGSVSLFRLRSDREKLEAMEVKLDAARDSVGLYTDERGHVFVSEDGRLAEFDSDGRRVTRSPFIGQPAGAILQMLRPFSNFDPETMSGRSFRNVLPEDALR